MAELAAMSVFSKIAMGVSAIGTVLSTVGQLNAAKDAKNIANVNAENTRRIAEYNASIAEKAAGQEEAASQLAAKEARRQARLQQSRVLALVASSGGGAMDMDVVNAIAGFEEEGDLAARTNLYQGSESARKLRAEGAAGIWQGEARAREIKYQGLSEASSLRNRATGTLLSGVSSLAQKYGSFTK